MEDKDTTNVSIPSALFKKIENMIKGTTFSSVSSYVTHVLLEAIAEIQKVDQKDSQSKEDEELVKERLRALGYLG